MRFDETIARLAEGLARPLPGLEAQLRLAPRPRRFWKPGALPEGLREAAALLLVWSENGDPNVLLTVRSPDLPSHRGQVSLPGGAVDPGETLEEAARREAREEVALDAPDLRILGRLSPLHIPVSGFALYPIVASLDALPALTPSPREVARILSVPLEALADPGRVVVETWERDGHAYRVPLFRVAGETVWGATAMVLAELLAVLGIDVDPWKGEVDGSQDSAPAA